MKEYNIEVTMRVQIRVEARNLSDAKEKAIELAEEGYFPFGVDEISAKNRKE